MDLRAPAVSARSGFVLISGQVIAEAEDVDQSDNIFRPGWASRRIPVRQPQLHFSCFFWHSCSASTSSATSISTRRVVPLLPLILLLLERLLVSLLVKTPAAAYYYYYYYYCPTCCLLHATCYLLPSSCYIQRDIPYHALHSTHFTLYAS